ncbi:unnamed protein product, partial [marine sediment metagenome]
RKKHLPDSEDLLRLTEFLGDLVDALKFVSDKIKEGFIR